MVQLSRSVVEVRFRIDAARCESRRRGDDRRQKRALKGESGLLSRLNPDRPRGVGSESLGDVRTRTKTGLDQHYRFGFDPCEEKGHSDLLWLLDVEGH